MRPEVQVSESAPDFIKYPYKYIEIIIAMVAAIGGLYLLSPFYLVNPASGSGVLGVVSGHLFVWLWGIWYASSGFVLGWGIFKDKWRWRGNGLFNIALAVVFTVSLNLLVNGPRPLSWMPVLAIGLISAIIWLRIKWEHKLD